MTTEIDALIERVRRLDDDLAGKLNRAVAKQKKATKFGLHFEEHGVETVALPGCPITRGSKVRFVAPRGESKAESDDLWIVESLRRSTPHSASLRNVRTGDETERLVEDLVRVAEADDDIYPGLVSTGRIERGGDAPFHAVINAENHHALRTLQYTHRGKVDLVYIDPPYNTGNKTWRYNDAYVDESDSFCHSKWLSFMDRRLELAKDLLKQSGAIMVSIGDDEQHRLRMLMDQVFGAENRVAQLAVEMSTTSGLKTAHAQRGTIVKNVEYVLIYRKSAEFDNNVAHTALYDSVSEWDKHYSLWLNEDGTITDFVDEIAADPEVAADIKRFGFVNKKGEFLGMPCLDKLLTVSEAANEFVLNHLDQIASRDTPPASCKDMDAPVRGWIEVEADHRTYILTRLRSGTLNQVYTLTRNYRHSDDPCPRFGRTVIRGDLWKGFHGDMGNISREGGVAFNNGKKPIRLIKQLIRWANNSPDALILDFFGGSGTTAHAVMAMNAEDGGARRSILVTNNEVGANASRRLQNQGLRPGDPEWESEGVSESVTQPRLRNAATETDANVEFFTLTYEEPGKVRANRAFGRIAPLLWLMAGGQGPRIDKVRDDYETTEHYGVLFDVDASGQFLKEIDKAAGDGQAPRMVFVVTDDGAQFSNIADQLPGGVEAVRLYKSYLKTFEFTSQEDDRR